MQQQLLFQQQTLCTRPITKVKQNNQYAASYRFLLLLLLFAGFNNRIFSQATFSSNTTSGNWTSSGSWTVTAGFDGDGIPDANDIVNIINGNTITVNTGSQACASLNLGSLTGTSNTTSTLAFNSGTTLTVSGTVTLGNAGNTARRGAITMTSGGTLICQALAFGNTSGSNAFTPGTGTVQLSATNTLPTSANSTAFSTFNNLTISGGTTTLGRDLSITGNITVNSGNSLDLSTFIANRATAGGTLTVAGTLLLGDVSGGQTGSNFPTNFNTITLTGGTVNYDNSTGGQTVYATPGYATLTLSNSSGTQTTTGNLTATTLNTTSGGTLNLGTSTLSVTNITNAGTIRTQNTGSTPLTSGKTWGGTVQYDGAGQTVVSGNYAALNLSGSGTKIYGAAIPVSGALSIATGVVANLGAFTSSANSISLGGNGANLGSFGSTASAATFKNNTFFTAASTGLINVAVNSCSNPTITLSTIAAVCQTATSFSIPYTATTGSPNLYSISGTGITAVTNGTLPATPITVNFTSNGNPPSMSFVLTVSNGVTGCTSSNVNGSVAVNSTPTAAAGGSQSICSNGTATVSGASFSNGAITWTDNGAGSITAGSTTLTPTYTAAAGDAGNTVTLTMTVTNNPCVAATATYTVNVNAQPQVSAFTGTSVCTGDAGQLSITTSAGTGPFTIIYNPGAVSESGVVSGAPFTPTPIPSVTSNYTLTSITDANGCVRTSGFTDAAATITFNPNGTWVGTTTDWFTPSNWCGGAIPTAATDVVIPSGGIQPSISAAGAVCNNIAIAGTLTMSGSGYLSVAGNFTNNGTLTAGTGTTIEFAGTTQTSGGSSTSTFRNLLINSSTSLSLNTNAAIAGTLTVPAGKTLIVNGTTLTLNSGASGAVSGTMQNTGTVTTTGTLTFTSTGVYDHKFTTAAGNIPTATWNTGSTCQVTGYTSNSTAPGGATQSFSKFTWNCPNQTSAFSFAGTLNTVNSDFTVTSTGTGSCSLGGTGTGNLTIGGDYIQTGGNFSVSLSAARTVSIAGDFSLTSGTFDLSSSTTSGNTTTVNVAGDFTHTGGTITETGSVTSTNIVFNKSGTQLYTSGGTLANSVDFIVNSGSTLQMGTGAAPATISNGSTGTFTLSNGATLAISSAAGITSSGASGNIQVSGTRTFNTGANYTYIGSAAQATGNGLPATVNNLTISNTAGGTGVTLTGSVTVNGILNFDNGLLTTGANTVTIASAGSITNATSGKYVSGKLARVFTSTAAFTFPIGKGGNYRPAVFNYAAAPGTKTVIIEQFEAAFPVTIPSSVSVANFGNRYWNITQSATGTAFTIALNNSGVTPGGTVRIIRSEGGGASSSNATSFSSPNYSNSTTFATANVSSNVALGETAIPLTINGVTVTATKVYDGNANAILNTGSATLSGIISGDVVTLNSGSATGTYNNKHTGNGKAITVSGFALTGANAGAYSLPTPSQITGLTADITIRPITVSATAATKTYDGNNSSAANPAYTLQPGDATTTAPTQTYDDKNAGTGKTLTASGLVINDGNGGNNYSISYAVNNGGVINARNITVTAVTDTKLYDGNNSSSGTPVYTLQPGDATTTAPIQTFNNANAGTGKTLTASGLVINDGNSGNNYNINYATNNSGVINQVGITVTPDAGQFKSFGSADPVFTYTTSAPLISPDVFTGSLGRVTGESLGTYAYTLGSLSAGGNYNLSLGGTNTFEIQAVSQSNADFRSKANGNFSSIANWEYDLGGGTWMNATQLPSGSNNVSITHTINVDQDYTVGISKTFTLGTGAVLTVSPTSTLSVNGTASFNGHPVTFKSDATGTASLGQVSGTLNGATNVTVERYIRNNGFRSWRLLSVPTYGSGQTIKQAWQENQAALANNTPGYGTQITTTGASAAAVQAQGFDNTSTYAALLKWNGTGWVNETTTLQPIASQKAWFLFVRGDRSKGNTGGNFDANATTLRTNGTVYTGDQVNTIGANAFALVANVYPSAISFTGLTRTGGVSNTFYIWDSKKLNGNSLGAYQTFSSTNGFNCILGGGSYTLGQPNTVIESGQAFFVQSTTAGTITLKETAKVSGTGGNLGFRPSGSPARIDSRLYNSSNDMLDGNTVVFDAAYARAVDGDDAPKMGNPGANFAIETQSKILAIEGTQPPVNNDAIQFRMWNLQQQVYKLEFVANNLSADGLGAILEDKYLNTSTAINLTGITSVDFTVDANPGSYDANRFKIVFKQSAPLPISFISVAANRKGNAVKTDWKIAAERNIQGYEVERSSDGRNFTGIGTVAATNNLGADVSYNFTDAAAPASTLFYRIKSNGTTGAYRHSTVVKVAAGNVKTGYAILPNPVENGIMNLQLKNQPAGRYSIRIISNSGQTLHSAVITHTGGSSNQLINLPGTITRGNYQVEIVAPDKTSTTQSLLVNRQ